MRCESLGFKRCFSHYVLPRSVLTKYQNGACLYCCFPFSSSFSFFSNINIILELGFEGRTDLTTILHWGDRSIMRFSRTYSTTSRPNNLDGHLEFNDLASILIYIIVDPSMKRRHLIFRLLHHRQTLLTEAVQYSTICRTPRKVWNRTCIWWAYIEDLCNSGNLRRSKHMHKQPLATSHTKLSTSLTLVRSSTTNA